ncbi:MAG: hypothetical protein M3536_10940 [Actinomycetota bacterium]|nr:hypothetical protein [Actinomycetota bacterium]
MKLSINGNDVEVEDPDESAIITDVVILRRAVIHGDDGKLLDSLWIDVSHQTTRIVQIGMIEAARKSVNVWEGAGE